MTLPGPHLDLDALADLLAGEGDDAQVAHVGGCPGCAGRLDELAAADAEVAALLAGLPAPAVPDDLAERLQATFDAEPAPVLPAHEQVVAPVRSVPGPGSSTVTPFPAAGARRRTWLPAAAAGAVLLIGGGLGVSLLTSSGGDDSASTTAASDAVGGGAGALTGLVRSETGTDYAPDGTLAAALPGLLGGSAEPVPAPLAEAAPAQQDSAAPAPVPSAAAGSVPEALASSGRVGAADPALDRLRTPEGLASCLAALLPPDDDTVRPLALDYAAYAGQPALVVVLPATGAADKVDVFVVGAGCTLGDDKLLFFTRLDRP